MESGYFSGMTSMEKRKRGVLEALARSPNPKRSAWPIKSSARSMLQSATRRRIRHSISSSNLNFFRGSDGNGKRQHEEQPRIVSTVIWFQDLRGDLAKSNPRNCNRYWMRRPIKDSQGTP